MTKTANATSAPKPVDTATASGGTVLATFTMPGDRDIRVERVFSAPRERVWRAFADPALLGQWWGRGTKVTIERFEFERGGHWRFVEHTERGAFGYEGRYREVVPMERIVRSFEWDGMPGHVAIETVTFEDVEGDRTRVVTTLLCHTTSERDGFFHSGMESAKNKQYALLDAVLAVMK